MQTKNYTVIEFFLILVASKSRMFSRHSQDSFS